MLHSKQTTYNFYDYFIISIIASTIIGTAQVGLISQTFIVGILCLPFSVFELISTLRSGKIQPIILFMVIWLLYAMFSIVWTPRNQFLLREIWMLYWNIVIFIGLYHATTKAHNARLSILTGWCILIFLTLLVAFWEISTDSHIPKWGDFNAERGITTDNGTEHRIFAAVTYKNLNSYVTLLCMALPILTYGLFVAHKKILFLITILGAICIITINSSRGGLLCLACDIIIFILFYRKQQIPNKKIITLFVSLGLFYLIYEYGMLIARQAIGRLSAYGVEDIMSDAGRWDVWKMGIDFCINSFGFGCGVGSMQPMYASTGFWLQYSHNLVIEFIMQYGIWLFIPLGIMLLKTWLFLIKQNRTSDKLLGWMFLVSFIPLAIIDDTYLIHTFVWLWLLSQFALIVPPKKE